MSRRPAARLQAKAWGLAALSLAAWAVLGSPPAGAFTPPQIHTVAGGGVCSGPLTSGGLCDNVSATSVPIRIPRAVAAVPGGGFLYVDFSDNLVREVSPAGVVTTVAGDGTAADAADGTLAVNSGLNGPIGLAALPGGGFLVTEYKGSVVRVVSPGTPATATITTIAGTGKPGSNGHHGQATSIQLDFPSSAEPMSDGRVLISDTGNNDIKVLSTAAIGANVDTIAGGGQCDDATATCDGMPGPGVALSQPLSASPIAGGAGGYLIAEYSSHTIRKVSQVSATGTFSTVAGIAGQLGSGGDGGPATSAQLDHPRQVVSTGDGGFLIADTGNQRVRQVSASGTITTIAGTGAAGYAGDGGPATSAALSNPVAASPTVDGGFLIADTGNHVIRAVTIPAATAIALSPAAPNGRNGWYVSAVHATVSATGGTATRCLLDPGAAPATFDLLSSSCPFTGTGADITADGGHSLFAASANAAGDTESPVSASVSIDQTPPMLRCNGRPSFPARARDASLTATVSDAISGPASALVSAPASTSKFGRHQAGLTGVDNAGNASSLDCAYTVRAATLKPLPSMRWEFPPGRRLRSVRRLVVSAVAPKAVVKATCHGRGCPFKARTCNAKRCKTTKRRHAVARTVDLTRLFRHRRLAVGARLTVSVTTPNTIGRIWLFRMRAGKNVSARIACLAPGSTVPGRGC